MSVLDWIAASRPLAAAGWTALHLGWQLPAIAVCAALLSRATGSVPRRSHALALAGLGVGAIAALGSLGLFVPRPTLAGGAASAGPRVPVLLEAPGLDLLAPLMPWLGAAWLAWIAVGIARVFGARLRLGRLDRAPIEASDTIAHDYAEAARRLGMRAMPPLVAGGAGPAVIGWIRPVVVVPRGLFAELPRRDRVAILAHELAHVRRRDPLAKAFQTTAATLLAPHPAARWLSLRADREREKSCDDVAARAMRDPSHVARALARIALARPMTPLPALSASSSAIVERIERLARPVARRADVRGVALAAACGAALLAVAVVGGSRALLRDTVELLPIDAWRERVVFDAQDPAGAFTVAVEKGRAVEVTIDGVAVPDDQVRQLGQWVSVLRSEPQQPLHIRVVPPAAIEWSARRAPDTALPDPI